MASVLVLGGGFGGLAAANEIRRVAPEIEVNLVAATDSFFMGFAKLWDLGGYRDLASGTRQLGHLDPRGISFTQAEVLSIDPAARTIGTTAGDLAADALIVALGASSSPLRRQELREAGGFDLYNPTQLQEMRSALERIERGTVVIAILAGPFRCPPAPYEAAMVIDDVLRRRGVRGSVEVRVVTFQPMTLPAAGPDPSAFVAQLLAERDIDLVLNHPIAHLAELERDVLFAVLGDSPPAAVSASALSGVAGWIRPDRNTLTTSFENVYAVGDCTSISIATGELPKAGVFAADQGITAARNAVTGLAGSSPSATFDGIGSCFLELPGQKVAMIEGDFFASAPAVEVSPPSRANFEIKLTYERDRLREWLS